LATHPKHLFHPLAAIGLCHPKTGGNPTKKVMLEIKHSQDGKFQITPHENTSYKKAQVTLP
jgi:hypothetical protein